MNRYTAVIFDMDGTLLYTIDDMTTAVNLAMSAHGFPLHTAKEVETYVNHGARRLIELALPENKRDEKTVDRVLETYLAAYADHVLEKTRPYTGIPEMTAALKQAGLKLAVVSNKPDLHAKLLAEKLFPKGTFDYVSGSGYGLPSKPDERCTAHALEALGVTDKSRVAYVGDSRVDVETARNGGLFCIGVLWGFAGVHSFDEASPDVAVSTPDELQSLLLS